jgi:outer membrane receptor protein involved in Fe transport
LLKTTTIPLGARYFHPSGFFASIAGTYVDQEVQFSAASPLVNGHDSFVVVDAAVGFRLPNRAGIASLSVQNLLDEDFNYHDDSFREFQDAPSIGPYIPGVAVLGRANLRF